LRAVIFDYGMVLTGQPDVAAHDAMIRITGLPRDQFEKVYWADRHAYDEGKLTGLQFWQKLNHDAKLNLDDSAIEELNRWDARMWTSQDPAMLAWQQQLKHHGIRTAILSNMGDTVLANIEREFNWLPQFDALVWSFQYKMAKPAPEIYKIVLDRLGTKPEETLFIDDKQANIDAARALGILGVQFSTIGKLRDDLIADGLDKDLPLPELNSKPAAS
jgi:putative hydrolase of the HAD superfamily